MKHLSLLTALLLSSSMVYAGWITKDYKGDCLEMMCDCVEDSVTHEGDCCPSGTSFNGKGDAHIEYTPCKCLNANTYYNTTSQKCLSKPTCNPCQKLDVAIGTCVADASKNNQAVGACGKCDNGSVIPDTTKVTPCKICNTSNGTLTNKPNGTQVQDECAICQDGVSLSKENTKKVFRLQNGQCLETVVSYCSLNQEEPKDECSSCSQNVGSVILNRSSSGTVSVKVYDGRYRVTMTGGGGGSKMVSHSGKWGTRRCGGGSGGYFDGVLKLSKGDYTVVVGSGGERNYSGTATTAFGLTCSGGTSGNPGSGGGFSKQPAVQIIETYKSGRGNVGYCKQKRGKSGDTTAHGGASGITNTTSGAGAGGSGSYWGYNPGYSGLVKIQYLGP